MWKEPEPTLFSNQRRVVYVNEIGSPYLAHAFDHLRKEILIESFVRLVAVNDLGVDGNPLIHAQQALDQLLEIRSVGLAESLGDHKRFTMLLLLIYEVVAVH